MKQLVRFSVYAFALCTIFSCSKPVASSSDVEPDTTAVAAMAESDTAVAVAEEAPVNNSPFAAVTVWEIDLESTTTRVTNCSEAEAREIEANGDDDTWVMYDETEGSWVKHWTGDVVVGHVTITKPNQVERLNQMMEDSQYEEFREDVKIRGNKAIAKWYTGNRGGGMEEAFPKDVLKFIMK